jgi:hypothetical protein
MTGGGVVGLPLLLIFGFYAFQKPVLRVVCLAGAIAWMGMFVVIAITRSDWNMLVFPAILGLGWMALHPLLKDG